MANLNKNTPLLATAKNDKIKQLRNYLIDKPLANLPSLFLIGVAAFALITLASLFITSALVVPFILITIISSFFSAWHIRILGSMKVQIERLTEQNNHLTLENEKFTANNLVFTQRIVQFEAENKRLGHHLGEIEATADELKLNNDRLHQELTALQNLRNNLQQYAAKTKLDFGQILEDVNQSFQHLNVITIANERVLLQRIAQDLEFLDREVGMQRDEYQRFVQRIPEHLQATFTRLADTSFEQVAGDDQRVDHQEIKKLVQQLIKNKQLT